MRNITVLMMGGSIALGLSLLARPANAFSLFIDDRAGFNQALTVNPLSTVVDSGGAFAQDPLAATNVSADHVIRQGLIGGSAYGYSPVDANFSLTPTGAFFSDIASVSRFDVETPVAQDGAAGTGSWGLDSATDNDGIRNALGIAFSETPGGLGVGHFGVDLHDFESSPTGALAQIRLYQNAQLVFAQEIDWGNDSGNGQSHFLGVAAMSDAEFFDSLLIVLGDDGSGGTAWAADNFTLGQASAEAVPTPALLPGMIGFGMSLVRKKRKQAIAA